MVLLFLKRDEGLPDCEIPVRKKSESYTPNGLIRGKSGDFFGG